MMDPAERPENTIYRLVNGYRISQAISVAATLGIADLLADAPRASNDLAAETGVNSEALYRLMRALASLGLFQEEPKRTFRLTELGAPETGSPLGPKTKEASGPLIRGFKPASRMMGLPGDVAPRSDASGHPINRAFADMKFDKPVVEPEPGFEGQIHAFNLFDHIARADVTWNPSFTSITRACICCVEIFSSSERSSGYAGSCGFTARNAARFFSAGSMLVTKCGLRSSRPRKPYAPSTCSRRRSTICA